MKPQKDGGPLNDEERLVAMSIHLLACMIDGDMATIVASQWGAANNWASVRVPQGMAISNIEVFNRIDGAAMQQ